MNPSLQIVKADWMRIDLSEFRYGPSKANFSVRQSVEMDAAPSARVASGSFADPIELGLTVEVEFLEDKADEPYGTIRVHGFGRFSRFGGRAVESGCDELAFLEQSGYSILYGHISDHVNRLMRGAGESDFWLPHLSRENFVEDVASSYGPKDTV